MKMTQASSLSKTSHNSSFERVGNGQQFLQLNHPALHPSFNSLCICLPRPQVNVETPNARETEQAILGEHEDNALVVPVGRVNHR
jgi:hypothetical protein